MHLVSSNGGSHLIDRFYAKIHLHLFFQQPNFKCVFCWMLVRIFSSTQVLTSSIQCVALQKIYPPLDYKDTSYAWGQKQN